jgi:penicillin-binding protein 1A
MGTQLQGVQPRGRVFPRVLWWIALLVASALVLTLTLIFAGVSFLFFLFWNLSRDLPDAARLRTESLAQIAGEPREFAYMPLSSMPETLPNAFVAVEDRNFFAQRRDEILPCFMDIVPELMTASGNGGQRRGPGPVTLHIANIRLLRDDRYRDLDRSIRRAVFACQIERVVDKSRILELYLNEIYLGKGAYGVAAGARRYFGKDLSSLPVEEIAFLAVLPKAPNGYDPARNYEKALQRRNWVIGRMAEEGYISRQEAESAAQRPLAVIASKH